jgi:hypothetical protein
MMHRFAPFLFALALVAAAASGPTAAGAQDAGATGTVSGTVSDASRKPLGGTAIDISGHGATVSTISAADGSYSVKLVPGVYSLSARKGGYQTIEGAVRVLAGETSVLNVTLVEASTSNLRVIGATSTVSSRAASTAVSSVSSLPSYVLLEQQPITLQNVLTQIPGVTFDRGQSSDPYEYFAVRGGTVESRVEIDGHPISLGTVGKWNVDQVDPDVFDGVDVFKGAGVFGANAGESVFGTINLRTRDFTPGNAYDVRFGIDQYGAQTSTFAASGNLGHLGYVLNYNVAGDVGPQNGIIGNEVELDPNNPAKAIVAFQAPLNDSVREASELAKVRYNFSSATSLSAGFLGFQGTQNPQGVAYGTSTGTVQIEEGIPGSGGSATQYNAPYAQNLIGHTITGYQWYPGTTTTENQPFFEAEFRTALNNDTILLRPYTGVITRVVDGTNEANFPDGQFDLAWTKYVSNTNSPLYEPCSVATPCYLPGSSTPSFTTGNNPCATVTCYQPQYGSAYYETEVNRLHGTTFSYIHPFGQNDLNFTYDYHSDETQDFYSAGTPAFSGGTVGDEFDIAVAPTTAKTTDLGLTSTFRLTPALKLAAGLFQTNWKLEYLTEDPAIIAANPNTDILDLPLSLVGETRTVSHFDPHFGLNYRPTPSLALRFSAGSGITVPYASQVSGIPSVTNPSGTFNQEAVLEDVNPNLNPEVTVAYDLGADLAPRGGPLVKADLFDNTIHNAFVLETYPVTANPKAPRPYQLEQQWLNGPIERSYGLELELRSPPHLGLGYDVTGTLQRAYYDQLPRSFYASGQSDAINGQQISAGDDVIPYVQAHGELRYSTASLTTAFGADYTGANNWTYGPAFTTFFWDLHKDVGKSTWVQISAYNLFNFGNGTPFGSALLNGGYNRILLGPCATGTQLCYGSSGQSLQAIEPLSIRFQVGTRIGY